jgi:hypothetical protein
MDAMDAIDALASFDGTTPRHFVLGGGSEHPVHCGNIRCLPRCQPCEIKDGLGQWSSHGKSLSFEAAGNPEPF